VYVEVEGTSDLSIFKFLLHLVFRLGLLTYLTESCPVYAVMQHLTDIVALCVSCYNSQ